jgi:alpha-tubulin suppressor-like RCC1 family protein
LGGLSDVWVPRTVIGLNAEADIYHHAIALAGGWNQSLALRVDGSVGAWGRDDYGQLGDDTTTSRKMPAQVKTSLA